MKRALKKSIAIVLSMLLLLSLLPMTAFADEEPAYPTIEVGETKNVNPENAEDGYVYFQFTPTETGWYALDSFDEEGSYLYGRLQVYDHGDYYLLRGWSSHDGEHLHMVYKFQEGMTYRFDLESDSWTGAYSVTLVRPKTYTIRFHSGEGIFINDTGEETDIYEIENAEGAYIEMVPSIIGPNNGKRFAGYALNSEAVIPDIQYWNYTVTGDADLYAVYSEPITITYDCNGGYSDYSGEQSEKFEITTGAGAWFSYNMAYYPDDAKIFLGWFSERDGGEQYTNDDQMMETTTVYAHWADPITVTYNANGGTFSGEGGTATVTHQYAEGDYFIYYHVEHPEPNMQLIGWFTEPEGGEEVGRGDYRVTKSMTVYAHWKKMYPVTLNANGGYFADIIDQLETVTFYFESDVITHFPTPVNDDGTLVFDGWYDQKTGGNKYMINDPLPTGKTIYAHWIEGKTIVFDANGGSFKHSGETTLTRAYLPGAYISEEYYIRRNNMVNADSKKVFLGWATSKTATKPDITFNQQKVDDYTTLYAVWADGIKITENAGEGYFRGNYDYGTGEYEKLKSLEFYVPVGTRVGSLYSYYTGISGSNGYIRAYTDQPKKADFNYRSLSADGPTVDYDYELTEDTVLYVLWKDTVTITFEAGDGYFTDISTYTPITQKTSEREKGVTNPINYMESFEVKSNDSSKAFIGWSETGKEEDIITSITPERDMTLYAVYKSGPKVTFVPNMNIQYWGRIRSQQFGSDQSTNQAVWPAQTPLSKVGLNCNSYANGYYLVGYSTTSDGANLIPDDWYPTKDTTLYIIFAEGYEVYFEAYPGTFPSNGKEYLFFGVNKGTAIGKVETPVQPGKVFVGWKNFQTQQMIDPETYVPTDYTELYAVWEDGGQAFKDVQNPSAWYYDTVYKIASTTNANGNPLMSGYSGANAGKFGPADPLTRQDFAIILYRLADEPEVPEMENPFKDTNPKGYYYTCVLWAKATEVIAGYNDGRFGVGDKITREQVATILYRFAKDYMKIDTSEALGKGDLTKFKDGKAISSWAEEALTWATGAGVISGKSNGTMIDARGNAARAEIGAMVLRFIEYMKNAPSITDDVH